MKKALKYVKQLVNIVLIIVVISFAIVVCLQRFSNNEIAFLDYRLFTVISGSMEPKYKIGDVLLAKEIDPSKIKKGDDISYLGEVGNFKNKVVTHQVIKIEKDENGKYLFHTKGIANLTEDPIVKEEQVYGKIVHEAKLLSFVYGLVAKPAGMFIFVIVPVFYIIGSEFLSFLLEKDEEKRNKAKKRKNNNKAKSKEKEKEE